MTSTWSSTAIGGELLFKGSVDATDTAVVGAAWQASSGADAATALGLTPAQARSVVAPPGLTTVVVEQEKSDGVGRLVGTLAAILLFLSLNTFGALLLTGVVEEKTTAVVEVLLAHVRAHVLLAGKVLGIGLVALAQFVVLVAVGIVALRISGTTVPRDVWVAVPSTHRLVHRRLRVLRHPVRPRRLVRVPPGGRPVRRRADLADLHRRVPRRVRRRRQPGQHGRR